MKVVCIDDTDQYCKDIASVKKGNIYTVIDFYRLDSPKIIRDQYSCKAGCYYILAECGNGVGFHESMFIEINENQMDETTFERTYNKELQPK